jgi:hypothetical protein
MEPSRHSHGHRHSRPSLGDSGIGDSFLLSVEAHHARTLTSERVLSEAEYNSWRPQPRAKDGYPLHSSFFPGLLWPALKRRPTRHFGGLSRRADPRRLEASQGKLHNILTVLFHERCSVVDVEIFTEVLIDRFVMLFCSRVLARIST